MADTPEIPPFRSLGYLNGIYFYYSRGEQSVVELSAGAHNKKNFYRLAPHSFWAKEHPATKQGDFDENAAASALMATCQLAGIFSIKYVRGRGVWMDDGKPVIHYGNIVSIDGMEYLPHLTPGKLIYELAEPLGFVKCAPLKDSEGAIFQELLSQLRWQTPDQYKWFCGWLVCALIGGALYWRPHIWLTGGAQSGKTTLSGIMTRILGGNCLYIKSVSTEAGIRQTLKADCLAVVMDEAEREDASSHSRLQSILTLARQASSDDDSRIVKGTPGGNALAYQIRSPFCLSSINPSLVQTADKGRFTNIELSSIKLAGDDYDKWKAQIDKLLTSKYIQALYSRAFTMVPTIVANARQLAKAIERKTGDRRLGDQYGALLAGYESLSSQKLLSEEDAKWLIDDLKFDVEKEKANGINDQHRLLNKIMQHMMRVEKNQGFENISIGEMCQRVHAKQDSYNTCKGHLANIGIKVTDNNIAIANDNENMGEILKTTQWPNNWMQTLQRLTFATPSKTNVYFNPTCKVRATILPIANVLFGEDDDQPSLKLVNSHED